MKGLFNVISWRTLAVGVVLGIAIADGFHWAVTFYAQGNPIHVLWWR